jgi:NADH-quinone oxidoreductase subunit H
VIPFNYNNVFVDLTYGVFFFLSISSLGVYGVILAGWSSNSKYAFLGATRCIAQLISYELVLSISIFPIILLTNSLNFSYIVYFQSKTIWFIFPLFPAFFLFLIAMLAETNRTPFDLAEAEAELVAGYNVEYSSIIFAMFFLGEYGNMLLMASAAVLFFLGGWSFFNINFVELFFSIKIVIFCFFFIFVRAQLPRFRYDQLMAIG